MKNKYLYIFVIVIILIIIGFIWYSYSKNDKKQYNENSTNTTKLSAEVNIPSTNDNQSYNETNVENSTPKVPTEQEVASYSTPLKSKASGRLTNIRITCSRLNGIIVTKGETFSFCDTLGPSTAEKGYQEADVIVNGKTVQSLGGGNCQVSSTMYNAVLAVSGLTVIERHEHGKDVTYVPDDKDAAVAHDSMDFKFKNDTDTDIKMYLNSDDENVTVRLSKLVY